MSKMKSSPLKSGLLPQKGKDGGARKGLGELEGGGSNRVTGLEVLAFNDMILKCHSSKCLEVRLRFP